MIYKLFLSLILILSIHNSFSQEKTTDWKFEYKKQLKLKELSNTDEFFVLRLWNEFKQVVEFSINRNGDASLLNISYIKKVKGDNYKLKKVVYKKNMVDFDYNELYNIYIRNALDELVELDSLYRNEFLPAKYEFEMYFNGRLYYSLIPMSDKKFNNKDCYSKPPKEYKVYRNTLGLIRHLEEQANLLEHYDLFLKQLSKGQYSDGNIVFKVN